ncbi:MAG: hypothetical protein PHQ42_00010 [Patescibacteria group bacterium]|nr:hypothetical protein [Patescibacteria group bacterium]
MYYLSEKRNKLAYLGLLTLGFSLLLFGFRSSQQIIPASAADAPNPDAIAIRVIPNLGHYGVSRWYNQQGFKGSPQPLTIDGYEAIRDGRTIYVNAANVVGDNLYTNIYLISYNQEAEAATKSILEQIISHWKFNTNIDNAELKEKITRDTKRLSRLAEIKIALDNYKETKGHYPKLEAGTYLANKTISTWPSWQQTLAKELGVGLPTDPVNKLGACPGYDSITCWNEAGKTFAGATLPDGTLELPADSNAFVYTAATDGSSYDVCGVMESGYINLGAGACAGSAAFGETLANRNPVITCGTLVGTPGEEFKGYVGASDPDGDVLTWSLDTSGTNWTGWSAAPVLRDTANLNQKEIYSLRAGNNGNYNFSVAVNDSRGGTATKICTIKIMSVSSPCLTDGSCDGVCPANCTAADDPDCKITGCRPGDGKCDPAVECSTGGSGDCKVADCCGNGTCDAASGENSENCPEDCGSAPVVRDCQFNITFPCLLQ